MTLAEKRERAAYLVKESKRLLEEHPGDIPQDVKDKVDQYMAEHDGIVEELRTASAQDGLRAKVATAYGDFHDAPSAKSVLANALLAGRSIGEQFMSDPKLKAWLSQVAPSGIIPEGIKGLNSPPIGFKSLGLFPRRKELIMGADDTSAGAFVQTDYTNIYELLGRFPLTIRDLISVRQTTSDLVEFVRQTRQVVEAAPTPEANVKYVTDKSEYSDQIPGTKPQGRMNFEKVVAMVKTIAVYVGATKRALADAAQIRGIIDQELRDDIAEELENQLLNGNGAGENFLGVLNTPGTLVQAFGANLLATCRQAITTLRVTGRATPSAWVMNPVDWETIELTPDLFGRYYYGGPLDVGRKILWGIPVVECQSKPPGTAILADWRKAVLWDRELVNISMTDSHDDWFIRNIIAILAEMRAAFALIRPTAFIEVALAP